MVRGPGGQARCRRGVVRQPWLRSVLKKAKRMAQRTKVGLPFLIVCGCAGATAQFCRMGAGDQLPIVEVVRAASVSAQAADENEQLARTDPLRFLQQCLDYHRAHVRDYRCTFIKQESVQGHSVAGAGCRRTLP